MGGMNFHIICYPFQRSSGASSYDILDMVMGEARQDHRFKMDRGCQDVSEQKSICHGRQSVNFQRGMYYRFFYRIYFIRYRDQRRCSPDGKLTPL